MFQEPPETPGGLKVVSFSSRTVNLTWDRPFDGRSPISAFLVEYKKAFRKCILIYGLLFMTTAKLA